MTDYNRFAFIALGSNLGDSPLIISRAMEHLQSLSDAPFLRSSLWESTPVDCPPGSPLFVNAVVGLIPRMPISPEQLLRNLKDLEKMFGRAASKDLNAPRLLDLDLIVFGQQTHHSDFLILPHPRACQRRFVLQPLSELAPDFIFPGQTNTVQELLADLSSGERLRRIA